MRKLMYKIRKSSIFAWVVATSPKQCNKVIKYKATIDKKILESQKLQPKWSLQKKLKTLKNVLILIVKNLTNVKSTQKIEFEIKRYMGKDNAVVVFFWLEGRKHMGSCNIQRPNPAIYEKYLKYNVKTLDKYVEFIPHPKSLDGINRPTQKNLHLWGFWMSTRLWQTWLKLWEMAFTRAIWIKISKKL